MYNKAILIGRLTRDPELRHTQNNKAVCSFTLAIDRDRKDANGEKQADFIDCTAWGKQAEFVSQWFRKGMLAIVDGRVQSRNWEDRNGNRRTSIEINCEFVTFGETKKAREAGGATAPSAPKTTGSSFNVPEDIPGDDFEEPDPEDNEVPF